MGSIIRAGDIVAINDGQTARRASGDDVASGRAVGIALAAPSGGVVRVALDHGVGSVVMNLAVEPRKISHVVEDLALIVGDVVASLARAKETGLEISADALQIALDSLEASFRDLKRASETIAAETP